MTQLTYGYVLRGPDDRLYPETFAPTNESAWASGYLVVSNQVEAVKAGWTVVRVRLVEGKEP